MASAQELLAGYKAKKGGKGSGVSVPTKGEKKSEESIVGKLRTALSDSKFGSFMQGAAEGITFGTDDEMKAALYSAFSPKSYSEELETVRGGNEARAEKYKGSNIAGQLGGSILQAAAMPMAGATSLMGAVGRGAAGGAMAGAAQGFGEGEGFSDRMDAAVDGSIWGGAFGGVLGAGGRALQSVISKAKRAGRPPVSVFQDQKNADYDAWRKTGEIVDTPTLKKLAQDAKATVRSDPAYEPNSDLNAGVERTLKKITKAFDPKPKVMKDGTVVQPTVRELHPMQLDKYAQDAWAVYKQTNNPKMLEIINTINDTINALPESGPLAAAAKASNSRYHQIKLLEHTIEKADLKDAAGNTYNTGQRYRNAMADIVSNPNKARGFKPETIEAMRKIADGTLGEKALATVGKAAPTGSGLMQLITIIGAVHNPVVAGAVIGSHAAREGANIGVKGKVQSLMDDVAGYQRPPVVSQPTPVSRAIGKDVATAMPPLIGGEQTENTDAQNMLDQVIQQRLLR